jgi:hypothetical protein
MDISDQIQAAIIEAKTDDRRGVPVETLEHMALSGDETPVSGDALTVFA